LVDPARCVVKNLHPQITPITQISLRTSRLIQMKKSV